MSANSLWLAVLLMASSCLAYPSASDSTAFLYAEKLDGSIIRLNLDGSNTFVEKVPARLNPAKAIGLLRGSGDQFSLLYGDYLGIRRQQLAEFGTPPAEISQAAAFDSAVFIGTDPYVSSSPNFWVFQSRVSHHALSRVDIAAPFTSTEIGSFDQAGWITDFIDGAIDESSQFGYGLYLNKSYSQIYLYRWNLSGGSYVDVLPTGSMSRKLTQFVLTATKDTVIFYDAGCKKFVRMSLSTTTWTDSSAFVADTVLDFALAKNGDLVWSNGLGIYRASYTSPSVNLINNFANVVSIAMDDRNVRPFADPTWNPTVNIAIGGVGSIQPNSGNLQDYDNERLLCKTDYKNPSANFFFSGCSLYVDVVKSSAPMKHTFPIIVSDPHGATDTVTATVNVVANSGLSIPTVSNTTVPAFKDTILGIPVSSSNASYYHNVNLFLLTQATNISLLSDTKCYTRKEKWFAQSFLADNNGQIKEITFPSAYKGPVLLQIFNGNGVNASFKVYEEYFQSSSSTVNRTFNLGANNSTLVNQGLMYTVKVIAIEDSMLSFCLDTLGNYPDANAYFWSTGNVATNTMGIEVRLGSNANGLTNLSNKPDSLRLGFVASPDWVGTTRTYRTIIDNGLQSAYRDIAFTIAAGSPSSLFEAGPDVRIARQVGYFHMSNGSYADVYNWAKEVTTFPRYYTSEAIGTGFIQSATVDNRGGLTIARTDSAYGNNKFRMQRCWNATVNYCSNWDTVNVFVSRPPSVTPPTVDSLIAGTENVVRFIAKDPDVGDMALIKGDVVPVLLSATQSANNSSLSARNFVQSFLARKSGPLHIIQIKASIPFTKLPVSFFRLKTTGWTSLNDTTQAIQLFQTVLNVKDTTGFRTYNLELPNIQIDSGKTYAVIFGSSGMDSNGNSFTVKIDTTETNTSMSYSEMYGIITPNPRSDLAMQVFVRKYFLGSSKIDSAHSGDTLVWRCKPEISEIASAITFAVTITDGTAQATGLFSTKIISPIINLSIVIPDSVRVTGSNMDRVKYYFPNWAQISKTSNSFVERKFINATDSSLFDGWPYIDSYGALSFSLQKGVFGTYALAFRNCDKPSGICSAWKPTRIIISHPPEFLPSFTSEIQASSDTTVRWIVKDKDVGDVSMLKFKAVSLRLGESQLAYNKLDTNQAVGQFFKPSVNGRLGEIRVFAKFSDNYVQYMIADSSSLDENGDNAILEGFAFVKPDTLMWHSIPIFGDSIFKANVSYQFSVGYGGYAPRSVKWGVDTTNRFAKGNMLIWNDDSSSNNTDSSNTKYEIRNTWDLAFQLQWKKDTSVTWISQTGSTPITDSTAYRTIRFLPTANDTGAWSILFAVSDGVAGAGAVLPIKVIPGNDSIANQFAGIQSFTIGQAAYLQVKGLDSTTLVNKLKLNVTVKSGSKSFNVDLKQTRKILAPLPVGKYAISWILSNATSTFATGKDSFVVSIPIHTPPKLQRWYLIGFGSLPIEINNLRPSNFVYRWDDMRTNGVNLGAYVSRDELTLSEVGAGYWYFAEIADSIFTPELDTMPKAVEVPVSFGQLGWNMVSNPWNWPILLDNEHEYFVWNDSIGGYGEPTRILNPLMGAWVNITDESFLTISPTPAFPGANNSLAKRMLARYNSPGDWQIQISLVSGSLSDTWNFFGLAQADQGAEPPVGLGERVSLAFVGAKQLLARDIRIASSDPEWTLQLGTDRARPAELHFDGIAALIASGKRVVLSLQDGSIKEIPSSGVVKLQLAKGEQLAKIQILDANKNIRLSGGIQGIQILRKDKQSLLRFNLPIALAGKTAIVEFLRSDGSIVERRNVTETKAGTNEVRFLQQSGTSFVCIKVGKETGTIAIQ